MKGTHRHTAASSLRVWHAARMICGQRHKTAWSKVEVTSGRGAATSHDEPPATAGIRCSGRGAARATLAAVPPVERWWAAKASWCAVTTSATLSGAAASMPVAGCIAAAAAAAILVMPTWTCPVSPPPIIAQDGMEGTFWPTAARKSAGSSKKRMHTMKASAYWVPTSSCSRASEQRPYV